ncbi:MAG: hypothetical protein IE931_05675 [Sphingobacteriales bacterium]|nr:hypothetical protein [Sphingobacteriales bacterium]
MKYYVMIAGFSYTPKNKLEAAYQEMIEQIDRTIFKETDLEEMKVWFQNKVQELNSRFPRCKPLEIGINSHKDYFSMYPRYIHFNWYLSKDTENSI